MKNLRILLLAALIVSAFASCDKTELDLNYIIVDLEGDNADKSVSANGILNLAMTARDGDGVESVRIEIPVLNVDLFLEDNTGDKKWKINRDFEVINVVEVGRYDVTITVTDLLGNEYIEDEKFRIK